MMKNRFSIFLFNCLLSGILLLNPDSAHAKENAEINHLLEFIAQSNCTYIRNGKSYSALEAHDHIAGKYNSVKWRIKNAETFIRKIASHSSFSGKAYLIRCGAEEQPTEQWLFAELSSYRLQEQLP